MNKGTIHKRRQHGEGEWVAQEQTMGMKGCMKGCVSLTVTKGRGPKSQKNCRRHLSMGPIPTPVPVKSLHVLSPPHLLFDHPLFD